MYIRVTRVKKILSFPLAYLLFDTWDNCERVVIVVKHDQIVDGVKCS